jgi:prepilin-type N-terminal cleavage/methylation domain-containing protein
MPRRRCEGYTLIEVVVALLLFTVGGLALVGTSAVVGRELSANAVRERAGRVAEARLELLRAACHGATAGSERLGKVESVWSASFPDSNHVSLDESVTYPTRRGSRTDSYKATVQCR